MVRVMLGVPDRDIQEQTSIRPRDVVGPGPHHLAPSPHLPSPPVPTPSSPSRHKMLRHVFQSLRRQVRRDTLRPLSLRRQDVRVEVPRHQQLRSRRPLYDRLYHHLHRPFVKDLLQTSMENDGST